MEKNVARLKEEIKNEEEEINDMSGRSESKWKAAHELKKQLKAAEEKLAKAKGAESTGTLLIEGGAQASASNFLASTENNVAGLKRKINNKEEEINDLQGEIDNNGENPWWPSATTAHKANPDDLRAALKSKQQELGSLKEQLKAAKAKLAAAGDSAAVDDMDTDLLADAKGGKKAAAANQLASMEKNVARLKEEIKNEEEEINDMSGRSESKWKAAHELKKQLKAAEEKLAKAKGAESTGTLLIAFLASKQPIDASATNVCLGGTVAFVLVASLFTVYRRRPVNIDQRPLLSEEA